MFHAIVIVFFCVTFPHIYSAVASRMCASASYLLVAVFGAADWLARGLLFGYCLLHTLTRAPLLCVFTAAARTGFRRNGEVAERSGK